MVAPRTSFGDFAACRRSCAIAAALLVADAAMPSRSTDLAQLDVGFASRPCGGSPGAGFAKITIVRRGMRPLSPMVDQAAMACAT
jgi:hypothetical protein